MLVVLFAPPRVCLVLEEFVRLLHACGMSLTEVDICNGRGATVNEILAQGGAGAAGGGTTLGGQLAAGRQAASSVPTCSRRPSACISLMLWRLLFLLLLRPAGHPRSTLFTGSKRVAEKLARDFSGRVRRGEGKACVEGEGLRGRHGRPGAQAGPQGSRARGAMCTRKGEIPGGGCSCCVSVTRRNALVV